jgi:hypothetical protein
MTRIVVAINIHRPIGAVFDYITTPANWPAWHPASRAVSGSVDHSLLIGEQVTEEFVAGGRHGSCVWQVTQREAPYLWTITTSTPRVAGRKHSLRAEVHLCNVRHLALRRMRRESRIALEQLKERFERLRDTT